MKNSPREACLKLAVVAIACIRIPAALGDDTNGTPVQPATTAQPVQTVVAKPVAPQRLPYGVDDVLNLSRARISEDVIVDYIRSSGTAYTLGPREIVYLRDEGVSDHVITTMIDQRKKVAEDNVQQAVQQATQQAAEQGVQSQTPVVVPAPAAPLVYDPNGVVAPLFDPYVEEEPPPVSSLYVIPYGPARAAYYGSPYYGSPYLGAYYPAYYGCGYSTVYHFGTRGGVSSRHGSRGSSVHTISRR